MRRESLESAFWDHIYKVDVLLRETGSREKLETLFSDDREGFWNFARSKLGVCGGGFGLAHRSRREFFLLQNSRYSRPIEGIPYIQIPYITFDPEDRDLIDLLFIGRRTSHDLLSDPPEFYYHLPSNRLSLTNDALRFSLPGEQDLSLRKSFKFLYCSVGEICFFLYAWRWFVRYAQVNGGRAPIEPDDEITLKQGSRDLWSAEVWEGPEVSLESEWLATIDSVRGDLLAAGQMIDSETDVSEVRFRTNALRAWEGVTTRVDTCPAKAPQGLSSDWKHIGLFDNKDRPTRSLEELVRFGCNAVKKTYEEFTGRIIKDTGPIKNLIVDGLDGEEAIKQITLLRRAGQRFSSVDRTKVEKLLRRYVYFLVSVRSNQGDAPTAFNFLSVLHNIARFPIIPYFYLTALDGKPKEHLVFPVWESKEYAMPVKGFTSPSPDAVFCLLTLRPSWDLEKQKGLSQRRSRAKRDELETSSEKIQRFYRILTFFSHVAHPLVDEGFYGSLVMPDVERKRQQESARAFGHEVKHVSNAMTGNWVKNIDDLFEINLHTQVTPPSSDKLGLIYVWDERLVRELGVVPFKNIVRTAGDLINLWCLLDNPDDAPFGGRQPTDIKSFIDECWKCAINAVSVHAIFRDNPSNRERISRIGEILEDIKKAYESVVVEGEFPSIGWGDKGRDTVWLARVLVALLTNCAQHGDPARPVRIKIDQSEPTPVFQLEVLNSCRRPKEEIIKDLVSKGLKIGAAERALDRLSQARSGMSSLDGERFGTKEVTRLCLQKLDGDVKEWPEITDVRPGEPYRVRIQFRYLRG